MDKNSEKNLIACLGVILGLILIPLVAIYQGWVLTILWGWFIVPIFGLPQISIVLAIGLSLTVSMFKSYDINHKDVELATEEKLTRYLIAALLPLITLFFGYIVHLFI